MLHLALLRVAKSLLVGSLVTRESSKPPWRPPLSAWAPPSSNHRRPPDPLPRSPTVAHLEHWVRVVRRVPSPPHHRQRLPPISSAEALASMGEVAGERIILCLRNKSRGEDKTVLDPWGGSGMQISMVRDFFYSRINVSAGICTVRR